MNEAAKNEVPRNLSHNAGLLETLVEKALEKRVLVLMLGCLFIAAGTWAFLNVKVDAVPDISNIQVTVTTNARGLAPVEVEQYITYPVELALQSVPKLKQTRSISKYALSQVTAVFDDGTDIYWARQQVSERLKTVQDQMPSGADIKMALGPIATGLGEIYQFEVVGPGYSLMQLRDILDWQIIPALKNVPGIDEVQSMGGESKEYQIWLEPEKLHGYKVTPAEVCQALSRANANAGGGYILSASDQILIRAEGMLHTTDDIANVMVRREAGGILRVKDLGKVAVGKRLQQSIVTANGTGETVIGVVVMRKGENSKELVDRIRLKIDEIGSSLPANVAIRTFYDRGDLIERTIDTVKENLLHGAGFVLLVLLLLLGSIRGGLIAASAIPLSLAGSLIFLNASSISGNLLSLGAIDFGILIDGSVVMVENILKRLSHNPGKPRLDVVKEAAMEVAAPVFAAVLIITVVYLPILGLPGVSGKTFQPMALTVVFGLLTALLIALIITPAMSYFFLEKKVVEKENKLMGSLRVPYRHLLIKAVKMPLRTAILAIGVFLFTLCFLPWLGSEFIPVLKEGSVVLTVNRPISGSLSTAAAQTTDIERTLKEIPFVLSIVSRTGHSEIAFDPMGPDETDIFVNLKPPSTWPKGLTQEDIENLMTEHLKESLPGLIFSISQPIEQRMNELVAGAKSDVAIRIYGDNLDTLRNLGKEIAAKVSTVKGATDLKLEQTAGLPVVTAKLNEKALSSYGVFASDALTTVAAAVDGKVVSTIYEGKPRYPLTVRFSPNSLNGPESLGELPVSAQNGELIPLSQVAQVQKGLSAAQIGHSQGNRTYLIQLNVRGRDLGGFVNEARKLVKDSISLPSGYSLEWGGQFENMRIAQERLTILVPLSLLLIFALLFALYNDWRPGLLIFLNIPLAFSGGIVALFLRHMSLSVTAGVGFIALFGVAVLNGVVLISTIRDLEQSGLNPRHASVKGAGQRLRPVLMTALVASLGFIPMATATSVGAEVQRPLATVVIAGLASSTLLTLLVLPSLYPIFCGKKSNEKRGSRKRSAMLSATVIILFAAISSVNILPAYAALNPGTTAKHNPKMLSASGPDEEDSQFTTKGETSISFEGAVNEALERSPKASAIRLNLGIAKSNLVRAKQLPNPSIFMDNGYRAEYTYRYGASIPIEFPWKVALRIILAKKTIAYTDLDIARSLWQLRGEIRRFYTDVVIAREKCRMYSELYDLSDRLFKIAERRFTAGDVAQIDVFRSDLARIQATLSKQQANRELERNQQLLAISLGRDYLHVPNVASLPIDYSIPTQLPLSKELSTEDFLPINPDLPPMDYFIKLADQNRLELRLANQAIAQAQTSLKLAVANITPNPVLGAGSSAVNGPALPPDSSPYAKNVFHGFFLQTAVELPILNHQQGDISKAKAEIKQLQAQKLAQRNVIQAEVVQAYQNLSIQRMKIDLFHKTALAKALEIAKMTQKGYEAGQTDITSVLTAQQANVQTRSDYLEAVRVYQLAYTELEQVSGKSFNFGPVN